MMWKELQTLLGHWQEHHPQHLLRTIETLCREMNEGVSIWDGDGQMLFANPTAQRQFSIGKEQESSLHYSEITGHLFDSHGAAMTHERFPLAQAVHGEAIEQETVIGIKREHQNVWFQLNIYPLPSPQENAPKKLFLSLAHEVSEAVERGRDLSQTAHYDALTGLPNRALLNDRMKTALAHCTRTGQILAICLLDLDGFKPINDTLGHEAGDEVLKITANRLLENMRGNDTALRLGGDEFVLLINDLKSEDECVLVLNRILASIAKSITIGESVCTVTGSLGVTLFPNDPSDPGILLRHADQAMYKAKEHGKNDFEMFDPTLASRHRANRSTLARIAKAMQKKQFELHYQPQINCATGRMVGVEALIRWNHPVLGIRSPGEFLPLLEKDDMIIEVGNWVIQEALAQWRLWKAEGIDLTIGINIAARQLLHSGFGEMLKTVHASLPEGEANPLELEILETAALEDMNSVARLINDSRRLGYTYSLDDFGTGYSSLAHLKHLSVDALKIDQSYVRDMLDDPGDLAIVQGIIGIAEAFDAKIIAEGVENIDQIMMLIGMGCEIVQGFAIAKPMPGDKISAWLTNYNSNPIWQTARDSYPSRGQFEMLVIEVAHRHWFEQIERAYRDGAIEKGRMPTLESYDQCKLTSWYLGEGAAQHGHHSLLHAMDVNHRKTHEKYQQLCDQVARHDGISASLTLKELNELNNTLIMAIHQLRFKESR
ncbi:MAG: EAL domain-containing protein [Magnetococcales bacterium]|nr:EAL domain-containing protein [Magnetococcales bacterium]